MDIGLEDKTSYRDEVNALTAWCADDNLSLNVNKATVQASFIRQILNYTGYNQ